MTIQIFAITVDVTRLRITIHIALYLLEQVGSCIDKLDYTEGTLFIGSSVYR